MSRKYSYEVHAFADDHEMCMGQFEQVVDACKWFDANYDPEFVSWHIHARTKGSWALSPYETLNLMQTLRGPAEIAYLDELRAQAA